ncbi:MAG: hypothetical protein ACTSPM_04545 [Candidatus Heimdallarchaeota archaeon]
MTKKLFLEPHFGDIAWSCSGLVAQNIEDSIIVNLFPPRSKYYRFRINIMRKYRKKMQEEKSFERLFNIKIIYRKYKSAFLRGRKIENLFDKKLNAIEELLVVELRADIAELIVKENITELYCPYAQRNQIDHLIVKKAISGLTTTDVVIYYYEDFPNFLPKSTQIKDSLLKPVKIDITTCIEEKIKAVLLYNSLVTPYFKSESTLIDLIRKKPFEIYWQEK